MIKSSRLYRLCFFIIAFYGYLQSGIAEEVICKMTMCGKTYGPNDRPNLIDRDSFTIRVYGKYADLVEKATCSPIDQLYSNRELRIGSKKGMTFNPCESYVDIHIRIGTMFHSVNNITITLFGKNVLGQETKTFSFAFNLIPLIPTIRKIDIMDHGNPVSDYALYEGNIYQMLLTGEGTEMLSIANSNIEFVDSFHNRSIVNNYIVSTLYRVQFKKGATSTLNELNTKYLLPHCQVNPIIFKFAQPFKILSFVGPDLVDAGLNRKFGGVAAVCSGNNVTKVSTNRTTLDLVRAQIASPTTANPVVYQEVNWPDIRWGVKNIGESTTTSFTIQLKNGSTILQSQTLSGLASGEEKLFTYIRPKSKKSLYRKLGCNPDQDVFINIITPRSEADLVRMEPYMWSDPLKYTIVIDAFQKVLETDEANNIKEY
ncbi:MAG: hypothetical protein IPQ02_08770 [Saprospiraceae bacterium]|nr:hypothetical protein [Candidatus Defluviibacterium haderslevense]